MVGGDDGDMRGRGGGGGDDGDMRREGGGRG